MPVMEPWRGQGQDGMGWIEWGDGMALAGSVGIVPDWYGHVLGYGYRFG